MLKKIATIGSIGVIIIVIVSVLAAIETPELSEEIESTPSEIEADVIMPTKVSRPGCEEENKCYLPYQIVVEKGKEVTWINEDSAFHSVTSGKYDAPIDLFDSGHMDPYQTFSYTFDSTGIFDYYCTLHPWMEGIVVVE